MTAPTAMRAGRRPRARAAARALLARRLAPLVALAALVAGCAGARRDPSPGRVEIAITFDDLPRWRRDGAVSSPAATSREIARVLRRHRVPPSYGFMIGRPLEELEDLAALTAWVNGGQLLGNHTFSHRFVRSDAEIPAYLADVAANEPLLAILAGDSDWKVFRFPYLREPADETSRLALRDELATRGYRIADVTVDFWDYAWNAPFVRCSRKGDARAVAALTHTFVEYALAFLRWSDGAAQRSLGRRIPHVLLLHLGAIDAAALDALLTAYESKARVRWIPLERALADPAYRIPRDPSGQRPTAAGRRAAWRSAGFHERLVARPEAGRAPPLPYPPVPLPLLDALCR